MKSDERNKETGVSWKEISSSYENVHIILNSAKSFLKGNTIGGMNKKNLK